MEQTTQQLIELCQKAAELNRCSDFRSGNIICPPPQGKLIVSGDLHGHRRNFERIVNYADLANNPNTHLVLQEIIHGGPEDAQGGCLSFELLFQAMQYKLQFPEQVHFILGNHDTAVITDTDVLKGGREMNRPFKEALKQKYNDDFQAILQAVRHFLLSQPLALKTANRIWISHSLPQDRFLNDFDIEILNRPLTSDDMLRPNSAYLLTWGRRHSPKALEKLALMLDVDFFILGHQMQDSGWTVAAKNLIILVSEHDHGCLISLDMEKSYDIDRLSKGVILLAGIE